MMTETRTEPQIRVRIAHTHTIKDGWRLSETTVEYTGGSINWIKVCDVMAQAYMNGVNEANARNENGSGS